MHAAYLIEFANDKTQEKAIEAFLTVSETRCGFPQRRMLVTAKHISALEDRKIPYKMISDAVNGEPKKAITGDRPA